LLQQHKQYLLTGVSHVVPFIACGGILIALSIALAPMTPTGPDFTNSPAFVKNMLTIGDAAFKLFPAVLAGYIAFGMAGRPGLVAGFVGGFIAGLPQTVNGKTVSAGFLGALLIGLVAGHVVNLIKKLKMPKVLRPVMPIIVIPVLSAVVTGSIMLAQNIPLASVMVNLGNFLQSMQSGSQIMLAMVLGAMIAFDMGGPVNKAAFFFGVAMIQQGNFSIMGACAAAICTPPLGLGLATLLARKSWTDEQRESGLAALGMGLMGITEGAIPFAAGDPLRVIPSIMIGSMTAATIAMLGGVGDHAPHGGPIVLPVVDHRLLYLLAIVCGALVTAVTINLIKKFTEKSAVLAEEKK
jgi:fructose-specific phosphotransferase system IIC component